MRLCGKTTDGMLNAVEITYAVYVPNSDEDVSVGKIRMIDTDGDEWYVKNLSQDDAESIIYSLGKHGYDVLDDDQLLEFRSQRADDENDDENED